MIDWNWFFSSVAQSAAAIVGIIGAFVISNVLGNKSEFTKKLKMANSLQLASNTLEKEADARRFDWYNRQIFDREINKIEEDIEKNRSRRSAEEYYDAGNFSVYADRADTISEIDDRIKKIRARIADELRAKNSDPFGASMSAFSSTKMARLMPPPPGIGAEREAIDALVIKIETHCEHLEDFLRDLDGNPESSKVVRATLFLILALFFIGVIYPLSFMPVAQGKEVELSLLAFFEILFSIRGFILFFVSAAFGAVIYMFYRTNQELVYPENLLKELQARRHPESYSIYVEYRSKNIS